MSNILVSVIIPFYKNKIWLEEALRSVLCQTMINFEIIVINDGSEENIEDLIFCYADKVKFITTINKGAAIARNTGIRAGKGKFLAFLDSDDLWLSLKLEKQVNYMIENNFKWSHSDYYRFSDSNSKKKYVSCNLFGNIFPKFLVWNPIATPCVIIERDFVISNKLCFEEGKRVGEDQSLWYQVGKLVPLGYLNEPLARVRIHGNNAAFDAGLQLKARGESIEFVKANRKNFKVKLIYYYFLIVLVYCKFSFVFFSNLSDFFNINFKKFQFLLKFFFGIAYLNFRIIRKLL